MTTTPDQEIVKILKMPTAFIEEAIDAIPLEDRRELSRDLDAWAARAVLYAAYVSARSNGGQSDRGHDAACREANRAHKATRKAMGYHINPSPLS